jgi:hypothetical protein
MPNSTPSNKQDKIPRVLPHKMPFILKQDDVEHVRKIKAPRAALLEADKWAGYRHIRQCFGEITYHLQVLVK